jgi:hypothetical protein
MQLVEVIGRYSNPLHTPVDLGQLTRTETLSKDSMVTVRWNRDARRGTTMCLFAMLSFILAACKAEAVEARQSTDTPPSSEGSAIWAPCRSVEGIS